MSRPQRYYTSTSIPSQTWQRNHISALNSLQVANPSAQSVNSTSRSSSPSVWQSSTVNRSYPSTLQGQNRSSILSSKRSHDEANAGVYQTDSDFDRPSSSRTANGNATSSTAIQREANEASTQSTTLQRATEHEKATAKLLETVEFSFLDNQNVCCGICGEIVPHSQLTIDHLPNNHPEIFAQASTNAANDQETDDSDLNVISAEQQDQQRKLMELVLREKGLIESGFKMAAYQSAARAPKMLARKRRTVEPIRKVSSIRVNPRVMSLQELELALRKKMFEKLNRRVPVTLMDKLHARCGLCNAIISLNKKFEIVHLVRHFNCWHPTLHSCAGTWDSRQPSRRGVRLLSVEDFGVIDTGSGMPDSLQCIWCGMFVETHGLAQHFGDVHSHEIEVPKCNLCLQELILIARYKEKHHIDLIITLPDEHHTKCNNCDVVFSTQSSLDAHVVRRHVDGIPANEGDEDEDEKIDLEEIGPEAFANSRMTLGKRRRPKRQFIMPALRQAVPLDSQYVEPIAECHWKCKICEQDIYGAVISAAAIRHFKFKHPDRVDDMQYEICKSRLEKISDGCMEFVHPQLIECLLCSQTFNLHQPFNMCRAIRHLKSKHPNLMPEYAGLSHLDDFEDEEPPIDHAALIRRSEHAGSSMIPAEAIGVYRQQANVIHVNANALITADGIIFTNHQHVAQHADVDEGDNDEDGDDIIEVPESGNGTIMFNAPSTSAYHQQQYVISGGNGAISFQSNLGEFTTSSYNPGIRVYPTPQQHHQMAYDGHETYHAPPFEDLNEAAKNAHLDHGAIARQESPSQEEIMNHQLMSTESGTQFVLDGQLLEGTAPTVVYQPQVRQYYLVLQTNTSNPNAVESPSASVQQGGLLDTSMMMDNVGDRSMDQQSVLGVMDDSLMDAQRLNELMSQAHEAMGTSAVNDGDIGQSPQLMMTGDEPLV